jgi:hypothetical protein
MQVIRLISSFNSKGTSHFGHFFVFAFIQIKLIEVIDSLLSQSLA